jgi:glycosyltransferase involved in cell wall biosynthesis
MAAGPVDLFHIDRLWSEPVPMHSAPAGVRWTRHGYRPAAVWSSLRWNPAGIAAVRGSSSEQLRAWTAGRRYDLVWCNRESTLASVESALPDVPMVLDIDDLAEMVLRRVNGCSRLEWYRWRLLHMRNARKAAIALVCSETDRRRVPGRNVVVLPNCYRGPVPDRVAEPVAGRARILYQGLFTYPPNAEAAQLLVTEILPRIRADCPAAEVVLVGYHGGRLDDLAGLSGVQLPGAVSDMGRWLAEADLVAVPLRTGSGTRVKILEAIAHHVPVVSTAVGAEGLELRAGVEIVIEDDVHRFVDACTALLRDPIRRRRQADRAYAALAGRYAPELMRDQIESIVGCALAGRTKPTDRGTRQ